MQYKYDDVLIIIPARIGSTRLPSKPLCDISGKTLIEHVLESASQNSLAKIIVATDSLLIAEKVNSLGFDAIMTHSELSSGSQRVKAAFEILKNKDSSIEYNLKAINNTQNIEKINTIINIQGDMPFIKSTSVEEIILLMKDKKDADIGTLFVKFNNCEFVTSPHVVKLVNDINEKALYFSRSPIPYSELNVKIHLGIYAFTKDSLIAFGNLSETYLAKTEKLEQLTALENGMNIYAREVEDSIISIDTANDVQEAIKYIQEKENA
jgi:3-deoxy-manno-octulosonate cytidylyltransferase (CMP-KDO synthetase)